MISKRNFVYLPIIIFLLVLSGCQTKVEDQTKNITPMPPETTTVETPLPPTDVPTAVFDITKEPPQGIGAVTGKLCFPSEMIPPLELTFYSVETGQYYYLSTLENQGTYNVQLPGGQYTAFGSPEGSTLSGAYTNILACEWDENCADHLPIVFEVLPDQTTEGVDICDWYGQVDVPQYTPDTSDPIQLVSGLIYRDFNSGTLNQIERFATTPRTIIGKQDGVVPINNRYMLYAEGDDIWVWDSYAENATNLTQTEDRFEGGPVWSKDLSVIVFSTRERLDDVGPSYGKIGVLNTETGQYSIPSTSSSNTAPSMSQNSEYIAYDIGTSAWVYEVATGKTQELSFDEHGYETNKNFRVGSPTWSPSNTSIAWWVGDGVDHELVVLDLETKTSKVVYSYTPQGGRGGWLLPAYWSPDGKQIAFTTDLEYFVSTMYIYNLDTQEIINVGIGNLPVWSPDGKFIAFTYWGPQSGTVLDGQVFVWDVAEKASFEIPELIGTMPIAWFAPDAQG